MRTLNIVDGASYWEIGRVQRGLDRGFACVHPSVIDLLIFSIFGGRDCHNEANLRRAKEQGRGTREPSQDLAAHTGGSPRLEGLGPCNAALQPRMSGFVGGRAPNLLSGGPASTSMRDTTTGVVANLFGHKGYGFIRPDDCSAPRPTSF